jgi:hypothetical protein
VLFLIPVCRWGSQGALNTPIDLYLLRFRLRLENREHRVKNFIWIENSMVELEKAFSELSQIDQILNKRLQKRQLTHCQGHVAVDLRVDSLLFAQVL